MAPMRAPSAAPAPESFSFTVRLNFATVAQFDPLRGAWCAQLIRAYPTSTCSISNVYLGSVYVDTNMTFANGDPSANTMLAQLRDPTANSALFTDPRFGTVTVTSAGGTTVDAGVCSYQSPSMQTPDPLLAMLTLPVELEAALNCAHDQSCCTIWTGCMRCRCQMSAWPSYMSCGFDACAAWLCHCQTGVVHVCTRNACFGILST